MVPKVILRTATSLDGRITGFPADLDLYYILAAQWNPYAILFGSETVLAAIRENPSREVPPEHEEMFTPPKDVKTDPRPLLVIADSRGRCAAGMPYGSGRTCVKSLRCARPEPIRST